MASHHHHHHTTTIINGPGAIMATMSSGECCLPGRRAMAITLGSTQYGPAASSSPSSDDDEDEDAASPPVTGWVAQSVTVTDSRRVAPRFLLTMWLRHDGLSALPDDEEEGAGSAASITALTASTLTAEADMNRQCASHTHRVTTCTNTHGR